MKDDEILNLYFERDEAAITATAEKYGKYCLRVSYNILGNKEDAEECVNNAYLNAWESIPPQRPNNLATYLGKITRNLSINRYNAYNTEKRGKGAMELALAELNECIPDKSSVEESIAESELTRIINEFLLSEPEHKRNIFIRRYWYVYSIKDIAASYNMSESKVATLLMRMRNELKAHLEKEDIKL